MRAGAVYKYDLSIPVEQMYNLVEEMRSRLGKWKAKLPFRCYIFVFLILWYSSDGKLVVVIDVVSICLSILEAFMQAMLSVVSASQSCILEHDIAFYLFIWTLGNTANVIGYGHLGDGNLHLNVSTPHYDDKVAQANSKKMYGYEIILFTTLPVLKCADFVANWTFCIWMDIEAPR